MTAVSHYFSRLSAELGAAWNRFWFTPTSALALARVRIAAGLLALVAVATYWPDLHRFFDPDGLMPRTLIRDLYEGQWSVLDYAPPKSLAVIWGATLVLLALLTMGVGGRIVAVLAAALTLGFFDRGPLVTSEFEAVLAFLLVYLCVGRAGDALSLRTAWSRELGTGSGERGVSPTNTIAVRLIQIHVMLVHLMIGLAQLAVADGPWWSGEGIWLAMSRPGMSWFDFSWLADHPRAVAAWSHAMLAYLLAAPVLVWKPLLRPLVLAVGVVVWLAFAAASGWTLLSLAMLVGLSAFFD